MAANIPPAAAANAAQQAPPPPPLQEQERVCLVLACCGLDNTGATAANRQTNRFARITGLTNLEDVKNLHPGDAKDLIKTFNAGLTGAARQHQTGGWSPLRSMA